MNQKIYTFLLGVLCTLTMYSQPTPGGVSANLKLWVKSNSGVSTTGAAVNSWTYANDGSKSFTAAAGQEPILTATGLNFQPVITFTGTQLMDGPTGVNAPIVAGDDDYAVFVVWRSTSVTDFQRTWSQRDFGGVTPNGVSVATWNDGRYGDQVEEAPYDHTIQRPYTANTWNISQLNLLNQAAGDLEISDDRNLATAPLVLNTDPSGTPNGPAIRNLADVLNRIGGRDAAGQEALKGDIAEIIVYDRPISSTERAQVFSYLAVKYGVNIGTNIITSGGTPTTVWDATARGSYNNSVFGIGQDDGSGLLVATSNSTNTGSGNGFGQSGTANIVLSNPTDLATGEFMLIGNNNGALTEGTTDVPSTAVGSSRLGREWSVQHTGNLGRVDLAVDLNGITIGGTTANDLRLMVDEDGDGDFTTGPIRYYTPVDFTGGVATFSYVALYTGEVFSFITDASVSTPLPVTWKDFSAKLVKDNVYLSWEVATNEKAQSYVVEHSSNGVNFSDRNTVKNNPSVKKYSSVDNNIQPGKHYYRIRQLDLDGKISYSKIVSVQMKASDFIISILENPVRGRLVQLEIKANKSDKATIEIWSLNGAKMLSKQQAISIGTNLLKIPADNLAPGNYIMKVKISDTEQTEKLIKL